MTKKHLLGVLDMQRHLFNDMTLTIVLDQSDTYDEWRTAAKHINSLNSRERRMLTILAVGDRPPLVDHIYRQFYTCSEVGVQYFDELELDTVVDDDDELIDVGEENLVVVNNQCGDTKAVLVPFTNILSA